MTGFDNVAKTIKELRYELDSFCEILKKSDENPELLLTEYVLPTEADRMYVLTRFMSKFGEENFNAFIMEYFEKILKTLSLKIPIDELKLTPAYYNDEYVILGLVDDIPKMVINTFEKTVSFIQDDNVLQMYSDMDACQDLIYDLEQKLEAVSAESDKITLNKKRHAEKIKTETNMIITQLGIEKQNLSRIRENLEEYQQQMMSIQEMLDRYASRLVNYYKYVIIRTEG